MVKLWKAVLEETAFSPQAAAHAEASQPLASLDDQLRDRVAALEGEFTLGSPLPHEPALVEPLLGDIAALLDRCMAYQREASELEIKWVQFQLESRLAHDLSELDLQLARNGLGAQAAHVAQSAHADVAARFAEIASANPLAGGFSLGAEAASRTAASVLDNANESDTLLSKRAERVREHQADLEARYSDPGGAHNYLERRRRILALLFEDFEEAYKKAKVVSLGMRSIFDLPDPDATLPNLPSETSFGPVFSLAMWTRRMMRFIETLSENEVEYELAIPLLAPFQNATKGLVTKEEYAAAMKDIGTGGGGTGVLNFTLRGHFPHQSRVRVRGIGMSFVAANNADVNQAVARFAVTIFPPLQQLKGGQNRRRPATVLGTIFPFGPHNPVARSEGLGVHNLKPEGDWRVLVHPYGIGHSANLLKRLDTHPVDLRLHLSVVSTPDSDPSTWQVVL